MKKIANKAPSIRKSVKKMLIMTKLCLVFLSIGLLRLNASVYSQQKKFDLSFQNTTVRDALKEIEKQSEFRLFYSDDLKFLQKDVTLDFRNSSVQQILDQLFDDSSLSYRIFEDNLIIITPRSEFQQTLEIKGKVTDKDGVPLPGVNITEVGTSNGVVTDLEGNYSISVSSENAILRFSFVGYLTEEMEVANRTQIDLMLVEDIQAVEEVVVIGYGTVKKRDVTGSMASIKSEDFNPGVTVAPEQLMQGKVAGVDIVQSSGRPGATSTVRIRGASSISAGNDPLYVIDGIPMQFTSANLYVNVTGESSTSPFSSEGSNPLNTINPSDIESIEILKDASATAIYGSRGANGVILITTKSKKAGGESFSYDAYVGISSIRKTLDFLSADEFRNYAESYGLDYSDEGANTNWQDEVFRPALTHSHNIAFGGNSANSGYRASLGYSNQEGILISSALEKYTSRLNANHKALDGKLNIDLNLSYAKINNDDVPVSSNINNEGGNMLKDALRWAPTLPVYNEDGSYYQVGELRVNPVSWQDITDESTTDNFIGGATLTYSIFKPLTFSLNLGYNNEAIERYTYVPASHPLGEAENGRASISKLKNYSSTMEATLTYAKDITESTSISAMAGYSFYRYVTQNTFTLANQFVSDATKWNLMQSGTVLSNTSYKSANRLASVFGRINFKLIDRYLLTVTLRNDGSSRFGENNQWGLFPSGAFAWQINDEEFFNVPVISKLKLRLGYGITGNQEIPNYLYMEQLTVDGSSTYQIGGNDIPSVLPDNYANPDLKWEQTSQLNIGLDFGFLDNRFSGTFDVYKKKTSDLLLQFSTVAPSVVENQWANVGKVENKGFEVSLDGAIISNTNFRWRANLNYSRNVNEVISLSNEQFARDEITTGRSSGVVAEGSATQIIKPGLPLGTFWGRKFTGFDGDGMETYLDEDEDGNADEVVIGNANPDFTYGFTNSFYWKNFDASVTFRGVYGNDIYNNTKAEYSYPNAFPGVNVLKSAFDSEVSHSQSAQYSSRWIEDGSYLRLDNISIGYTLNAEKISFLSKARIYFTGQNLFVITNYDGFDPEVRTNTNRGNAAPIGIDYLSYPRPRIFMLGVNISFK